MVFELYPSLVVIKDCKTWTFWGRVEDHKICIHSVFIQTADLESRNVLMSHSMMEGQLMHCKQCTTTQKLIQEYYNLIPRMLYPITSSHIYEYCTQIGMLAPNTIKNERYCILYGNDAWFMHIAAAIDAGKLVCNMKILVCKLTHHTIIRGAVSNSPFWSAAGCNYMQQADMHVQDH